MAPSCQVTVALGAVGLDAAHASAGDDRGAGVARGDGEGVGDPAHAADGHPPLAVAVADQVVEEAPVLHQAGVVEVGEGADQRVGGDDPAHGVVVEALLDHLPDRLPRPGSPRWPRPTRLAHLPAGAQRLEQRRSDRLGEVGDLGVELAPGVVLLVRAGQLPERRGGRLGLGALDQEAGVLPVAHDRGVRRRGAGLQLEVEAEVVDDLLRHQADEVGVAREPGRHSGKGPGGHRRAAGVVEPLQHQGRDTGTGEVRRSHEAVVAAADDDDVVLVGDALLKSRQHATGRAGGDDGGSTQAARGWPEDGNRNA